MKCECCGTRIVNQWLHCWQGNVYRVFRVSIDASGWIHAIDGHSTDPTPIEDYSPSVLSDNVLDEIQALLQLIP